MKLKLVNKKQITNDTVTFIFELARKDGSTVIFQPEEPFNWQPGQFLRYHLNNSTPDERGENRFFSIASAPFEGHIQLTTRLTRQESSTFKKTLQELEAGDEIEVFGPSGHFTVDDPSQELVLIAGGIGITPFRAILLDLDHRGSPMNVKLIYANRTREALFKDELEDLAQKHPEFKIYYIISDEPITGSAITENIQTIPGTVNGTLIQKIVPDLQKPTYYISGPEPMVLALEKIIWDLGVPKEKTNRDYFPGYEQI